MKHLQGAPAIPTEFEVGLLTGLLIGEGHFGGDGRRPQVTLRLHVRHELIFRWIEATFPGGKLYGPYHHGGRHYYQWMARGTYLRDDLGPLLAARMSPELDTHSWARFAGMYSAYPRQLGDLPVPGRPIHRPGETLPTDTTSPAPEAEER